MFTKVIDVWWSRSAMCIIHVRLTLTWDEAQGDTDNQLHDHPGKLQQSPTSEGCCLNICDALTDLLHWLVLVPPMRKQVDPCNLQSTINRLVVRVQPSDPRRLYQKWHH